MKKISVVLLALFIYHGIFAQENDSLKRITAKHLVALDSIKKQLDNQLLTKIEKAQQEKVSREILDTYLEEYEDQMDYALYEEFLMLRKELGIVDTSDEKDDFSWKKVVIKVLEKSEKSKKSEKSDTKTTKKDTAKKAEKRKKKKVESGMVFGWGYNHLYGDASSDFIHADDYLFEKSRFVELGLTYDFYLDKKDISYIHTGVSVVWSKLVPANNMYHVIDNGDVKLATHSENLKMSKMRTARLKVPLGFGFDIPLSKKTDLKLGVSVYGTMKIGSIQKLEYSLGGAEYSIKEKRDFKQEKFNYGIQGHIGINGIKIYGGMDFAPYFMNQSGKMYFIGIRL